VNSTVANGEIVSDTQKTVAVKSLPKETNTAVKHDEAGVLGMMTPNTFYLTLKANPGYDRKYTALGNVIAGADVLAQLRKDVAITNVRITRVGQAAQDFKTDDESFKKLLAAAGKR
jgi:cyclophilin family peptidyl-prolyl cis-trans isomerase